MGYVWKYWRGLDFFSFVHIKAIRRRQRMLPRWDVPKRDIVLVWNPTDSPI